MFIESVQYSLKSIQFIVKNLKEERNSLPITVTKDNIKCLDFDLDAVVFNSAPKSPDKSADVNPYKKTQLDVMEMV